MPIEWTPSAGRHGVPREDALYAALNPVAFEEIDGLPGWTTYAFVGHPHAQALDDDYLEVLVANRGATMRFFHVMPLTDVYRHLLIEGGNS